MLTRWHQSCRCWKNSSLICTQTFSFWCISGSVRLCAWSSRWFGGCNPGNTVKCILPFQTISQPLSPELIEMHHPSRLLFKPLWAESEGRRLPGHQLFRLPSGRSAQSPVCPCGFPLLRESCDGKTFPPRCHYQYDSFSRTPEDFLWCLLWGGRSGLTCLTSTGFHIFCLILINGM